MVRCYASSWFQDFPDPDVVLKNMEPGDFAYIKDRATEYEYILTNGLSCWTRVSELVKVAEKEEIMTHRGSRMKVYERYEEPVYDYPDQMGLILEYLNDHGKILVSGAVIESLYREFSDERYSAGWMGVNDRILGEFEEWLANVER